jgi:DNA-binding NtrC family response regulator
MALKSRRTVLIVEDALTVRNMLEDFFTMYGYDVLMASDPDTAFKRLKDSHAMLDAMILDIALDDNRSGLEVLELMRLDDRFVDLTVVVLTGLANLDDRDVDIINRNRAHLLYKQEGYERVFNKLDSIIKPLRKNAAETLTPATPATQVTQSASATQSAAVTKQVPHLAR